MQVLVNGTETAFDEIEAIADIGSIARQFTLVDVTDKQNFNIGDSIEVYANDELFIKADIEYIEANLDNSKSEFVYAGRNKVKYIVDCYAEKTTQFTQSQKVNTVLSEIATQFDVKIVGDAQLPQQDIKTILIGEKIIDAFLEIAQSAGKIITSNAQGDLLIEFEAKEKSDIVLEVGTNILSRSYTNDTTKLYDKHTIVAQSNYLVKQQQDVFVNGAFGDGKFHKVKVVKNALTTKECEQIAEYEYKKDIRKSLSYTAKTNGVVLDINKQYFIKDVQLNINEEMNCKAIKVVQKDNEKYTLATFEKVVK